MGGDLLYKQRKLKKNVQIIWMGHTQDFFLSINSSKQIMMFSQGILTSLTSFFPLWCFETFFMRLAKRLPALRRRLLVLHKTTTPTPPLTYISVCIWISETVSNRICKCWCTNLKPERTWDGSQCSSNVPRYRYSLTTVYRFESVHHWVVLSLVL